MVSHLTAHPFPLFSASSTVIGGGINTTNTSSSFAPSSFTTEVKPSKGGFASLCDEPPAQRARVLYDYEASSTKELNLTADEVSKWFSKDFRSFHNIIHWIWKLLLVCLNYCTWICKCILASWCLWIVSLENWNLIGFCVDEMNKTKTNNSSELQNYF